MNETLLERVRRYLEAHAEATGIAQTPVPGLTIIRATTVSGLQHGIPHPQACLVLQGSKEVTQGIHTQLLGRSPGRPWPASGAVAAPR
uniref:AraC family transcriptional regulator N-terminal domain-containing protein n=1 Tax=Stutzerimonas nitrititolerans TaxID=2482751 RepID=UPI0035E3D215